MVLDAVTADSAPAAGTVGASAVFQVVFFFAFHLILNVLPDFFRHFITYFKSGQGKIRVILQPTRRYVLVSRCFFFRGG